MKVIRQPLGSNICGHCCLAMVADTTLETALNLIGHEDPVSTKEMVTALRTLNINCGDKLKIVHKNTILPKKAIIRVTYPNKNRTKYHWHWVAYENGYIFDSSAKRGGIYFPHHISDIYLVETKISSYLEIFDK